MKRFPPGLPVSLTCMLSVLVVWSHTGATAAAQTPEIDPDGLSLAEALRLAHAHNPDFRMQENSLASDELAVRSAWGDLLPSASASHSFGYQAAGERRLGSVQFGEQPDYYSSSYNLGLSFSLSGQSLLRPGIARAQADAGQARVDGAAAGLVAEVTQSYLSVLQADAELDQALQEVERTGQYVRLAEAQVEVGAGTPLDVRRAEVQEGQAEVRLLQARNAVVSERLVLSRLVGVTLPEDVRLSDDFPLFEPDLDVEELVARALDRNPVVLATRSQLQANQSQVRSAQSQYFPTLSLSAGVSGSIFQPGNLDPLVSERVRQVSGQFESCQEENRIRELLGDPPRDCSPYRVDDPGVMAGIRSDVRAANSGFPFDYRRQPLSLNLNISLPLFTGLSRRHLVEEARIVEDNSREQLRSEELRLRAEVAAAARSVETARRSVELQARIRSTAAEELRLAQERFRFGLASSVEVVDAQANLSEAERQEISTLYEFHKSLAALEALIGDSLR